MSSSVALKVTRTTTPPFRCDVQHAGGGVISVALAGELDMATVRELGRVLRAAEQHVHSGVLIDLRGLTFLDASGLHLLIDEAQRAREAGVKLTLVRGSQAVHRIFEVTELDRVLPIVELHPGDDAVLAAGNGRR